MDSSTESALIKFFSKFKLRFAWKSIQDLFTSQILIEVTKTIWKEKNSGISSDINIFDRGSVIEGFNNMLKLIIRYFKKELRLIVNLEDLGIDTYDLVNDQSEFQLLKVLQLIIIIILKSEDDTYINYIMELSENDQMAMQGVCQEALEIMSEFKEWTEEIDDEPDFLAFESENNSGKFNKDNSPDAIRRDSQLVSNYIDKINDLNLQLEFSDNEKRSLRIELSEEKKLNSELSAKLEKQQLEYDEIKGELETLERYKLKWEESVNIMKEKELQIEFLKQMESEVIEKKELIKHLKQNLEQTEQRNEEELRNLRNEIETLQIKNIELLKNESLVKMYKKKLDDLQDIEQKYRSAELERDALRGEIEQFKTMTSNNRESKKLVEFYKTELENAKRRCLEFENAINDKNHEVVTIKNGISKFERDIAFRDKKIEALEAQIEELINRPTENNDELFHKISQLEMELQIRKEETDDNIQTEKIIILEEIKRDREEEWAKSKEKINQLQQIISDLEIEIDNLKNELSTINENQNMNNEVQRTSIEGIKRSQIERELRKSNQDKIKIESELEKAKELLKEFDDIKKERDLLRDQIQKLYDQKNELQEKYYCEKEEKFQFQSKLTEVESNLNSSKREIKSIMKEISEFKDKELIYK